MHGSLGNSLAQAFRQAQAQAAPEAGMESEMQTSCKRSDFSWAAWRAAGGVAAPGAAQRPSARTEVEDGEWSDTLALALALALSLAASLPPHLLPHSCTPY